MSGLNYKWSLKADNKSALKEKIVSPLNSMSRAETVIASHTSYPARIPYVHLAIKYLMVQSYKPNRIILWLAEEQFTPVVWCIVFMGLTNTIHSTVCCLAFSTYDN